MGLPAPRDPTAPVPVLIAELAGQLGVAGLASVCRDLLGGAAREDHLDTLPYLSGHDWAPGAAVRDRDVWRDYWLRTWGARGLLHVWHEDATPAVLGGLADEHWRPTEMCLKVCARHDVEGAGEPAADLAGHERARVRSGVALALAVVGDREHGPALRRLAADEAVRVRAAAERAWPIFAERLDLPPGGGCLD